MLYCNIIILIFSIIIFILNEKFCHLNTIGLIRKKWITLAVSRDFIHTSFLIRRQLCWFANSEMPDVIINEYYHNESLIGLNKILDSIDDFSR